MKLIVKNNLGETVSIQIKSNETFMDLKERVEEEAGISLDLKDIALKGRRITETQRVMEYFLSYGENEEEAPSNIYCAVPGCKNTKLQNPDKVFFEFPTEEIRCHQWVLYCQRLNAGPGKKRLSLTSESTICSDHFRADQFVKNTNTLLKRTAVPCVKMPFQRDSKPSFRTLEPNYSPRASEFDNKSYFSEESEDAKTELNLRLCRLCAQPCSDYILIYGELGRRLKLAEKISLCLPIDIQMTDAFPKQICKGCHEELEDMYDLADTSSLAQAKLEEMAEEELSNEDLSVLSLNETGEEVVIGTSGLELNDEQDSVKASCPLCKEGKMSLTKKKEVYDEGPSSIFSESLNEMDPLDLGDSGLKSNCVEKNDIFGVSDYSDSICSKKLVDPLKNISKDSDNTYYCKTMYDTSDYDSQLDSSPPRDFKESDPLKLDDSSSKSDNDQISECYSSITSPLNIMTADDTSIKTLKESPLSPLHEELHLDPDFGLIDSESESSNIQAANELIITVNNNNKCFCRLCGNEFSNNDELMEHSFTHSYDGFYQCSACVTFYSTKQELQEHYLKHKSGDVTIFYFCDVCSKSFKSELALASHICKQEDTQSNKCLVCNKYFRSESRLKFHMKSHDNETPVCCEICDKVFPDEVKLQKHNMYVHSCRKPHCCEECGKVFKSEASMKYHQRSHQSEEGVKPYTCERCGKSFIRKSMLINHMTSSHKHSIFETPCFTCKLCYEAFPSTGAAVSHMDNHHKLECMDESTYSFEMHTVSKLFLCEFCDRCFAETAVLNTHREHHPADTPFECKLCDTPFSSGDEVKIHRRSHANDEIPAEYYTDFTIPKSYLCEYCERRFLNQTKYTEHLTVHYGPEPYQCQHCSLKLATLSEAIEHRANHGDVPPPTDMHNFYRPYECHYCNKTFAIEDALIKHIRMHTGEKPFICDQCGKGFSQSSGLYTHQKVHSSERPYSCSVCPRTFKIKGDRDVHVRKHSGDRPYKCEFCGKAFMTQHVYSQHRKIHTGERPYKCDVCGIAFRRSHVLTVHKRIHTGEKPNICDICGKRYRQKGDMLKHRRVQHGISSSKQQTMNLNIPHHIDTIQL